jgi:hypothetical protein
MMNVSLVNEVMPVAFLLRFTDFAATGYRDLSRSLLIRGNTIMSRRQYLHMSWRSRAGRLVTSHDEASKSRTSGPLPDPNPTE